MTKGLTQNWKYDRKSMKNISKKGVDTVMTETLRFKQASKGVVCHRLFSILFLYNYIKKHETTVFADTG